MGASDALRPLVVPRPAPAPDPDAAPSPVTPRWRTLLSRVVLGRSLPSSEHKGRKIGVLAGIPAIGLGAIASCAYGPEATLEILRPLGALAPGRQAAVFALVLVVLGLLYWCYRRTIATHSRSGGAYPVVRDTLGPSTGLLAAAALIIDYTLNVAVAISAGVAALESAIPALQPYRLWLCLGILALIAVVNLRGTAEAGIAWSVPAYLFLGSFAVVLAAGAMRVWGAEHGPVAPPAELPAPAVPVTLWLLARAFATGCASSTGVEAVIDSVTAFKPPPERHARRTLGAIVAILVVLLIGITSLCWAFGIGAMPQGEPGYQSVLSQLAAAAVGRGPLYFIAMAGLLMVLALSANTSFVSFPRLCRLLAVDGYLPRAFAVAGRRLVYTVGVVVLTAAAGVLLIAFGGITVRLIPLFAIGAFTAFGLSQAAMVAHARGRRGVPDRASVVLGGLGVAVIGAALVIMLVSRFWEGAWIAVVAMPALIWTLRRVHSHYKSLAARLGTGRRLDAVTDHAPPIVVVPIQDWDRLAGKAVRFGMQITPDIVAVHLRALEGEEEDRGPGRLEHAWAADVEGPAREAGIDPPPRLVQLATPYRRFFEPLVGYILELGKLNPGRLIVVVIPELTTRAWWQNLLHQRRGHRLRDALLRLGDPGIVVATVPWVIAPERGGGRTAARQAGEG